MGYPLLGLTCVLIIWASGFYLVRRWPGSLNMSLSLHAAAHRSAYWFFAVMMTTIGLVFSFFMVRWFIPHFELPTAFLIAYILTFCLQLITAWVPDAPVWPSHIHRAAAYSMAAMFFVLTVMLAATKSIAMSPRLFCVLMAVTMLASAAGVALIPRMRPHYLLYQSGFVIALDLAILSVTFWG